MDIKHVLSATRSAPRTADRSAPTPVAPTGPLDAGSSVAGGIDDDRPRRATGSRSTTRARATRCCSSRSRSPTGWSPTGEWLGVHRRRRLRPTGAVAVRRLGDGARAGWAAPLYWTATDDGWPSSPCAASRRSHEPEPVCSRQLLRGRRLRPLGGRPPADRGRVGGTRRTSRDPGRDRCVHSGQVVGVDVEPVRRVPGFPPARRGRRVQRQVHVEPDGAARRCVATPGALPGHLPQLLPAVRPLGVRRRRLARDR